MSILKRNLWHEQVRFINVLSYVRVIVFLPQTEVGMIVKLIESVLNSAADQDKNQGASNAMVIV